MSFLDTVRGAKTYMEEQGRVSLRALRREFDLDDEALDELVEELVDVQQVAAREGKVLSWIGAARTEASVPEPETRATPEVSPEPAAGRQPAEAERRQLTVMFCDLVGSTALSERLDAEALSEVVTAYQKTCAASVESFDGHIAQYLGDGVLVYFGYPLAHEDDAIRAIHAALRIVEEVPGLNSRLVEEHAALREHPLQVRVGIHTGPVVVGELGGGGKRERLALGGTVNIAARLEGEAEPGSIVVSNATRHLVRGVFIFEELGECSLKGIEGPVALFRPVQATGVQSRLALARASGLTPLVGREQEVAMLLERWEEAKAGGGQVVLLSGEAGMGKSRLIEVLREHVADEPHTWHEYRGSAYRQNSAFHPVIELIERAVLFTERDTPEERVAKLERGLGYSGLPTEEILPLIADFLGLPLPENLPPLALSPEGRRRRTLETIAVWCIALSQRQPLIMIAEDLHWWDPSSLEVMGMAMEQVPAARILLVVTFRPEFEPPWPSASRWMHLPLQPLTHKHIDAMASHIAGGKPLPLKVREQIAAKTDGVPLFVEELTKSVLESGLVVESDGRYERSDPLLDLAIPSTLRDSLTARLDRLGPAKEVAQLGAVLGREFSHDLLQAVSPLESAALDLALEELVDTGLLYQRGISPRATYIFKHALIQDAAHQSLLKKRRRDFNALVAQTLEERFPERVKSEPEVIARYYEEAGLASKAIAYYARAGEGAAAGCAHAEAIGHLDKSIALLGDLPADADRDRRKLRLMNLLGTSLIAAEGYSSPRVRETFGRAQSLCEVVLDADELASSLWGLATFRVTTGSLTTADGLAEQLADLADHGGRPICRVGGKSLRATAGYYLGRFPAVLEFCEEAIAANTSCEPDSGFAAFGMDSEVYIRTYLGWTLWPLGFADRAVTEARDALSRARTLGYPFGLATALVFATVVYKQRRDSNAAAALASEAVAVSEANGFPLWLGVGQLLLGWCHAGQPKALEEVRRGVALAGSIGNQAGITHILSILAEVHRAAGRSEDALGIIEGALGISQEEAFWNAELHRQKGELELDLPDHTEDAADALFRKAITIARSQEAKSLELRAATSLAHLWQRQGKHDQARELLQPIYSWFTEGFDTQDLKDAKALLAELS